MKEFFDILGLEEGASQEEIQEAYDRLFKELEPSKNGNQQFFIEEFEKLQEAYKKLRNSSILSTNSSVEKVTNFESSNSSSKKIDEINNKPKRKLRGIFNINKKILVISLGILFSGLIISFFIYNNKNYKSSEITIIEGIAYTKKDMLPLNGFVIDDGEYSNGLAEGKHKVYDKKGNIIAIGFFNKGKKNGLWQEWFPIKDGKSHFWFEKGLQKTVCNYKNGILEGEYQSWFENGQLEKKGFYINDKNKGNWYYYDEKGNLLAHFNCNYPIWAERHLDVTRYRNGDLIPEVQDPSEWSKLTTGAWCYYNNDPENGKKYGKLYNEYAINDPRGLAPIGYHITSNYEFFIASEIEPTTDCSLYFRNIDGEFLSTPCVIFDADVDYKKMGYYFPCLKN